MNNHPYPYISISDVNARIKSSIEEQVGFVRIQGEISSFTHHRNGQIYLTLKDKKSQLEGVIFSNFIKPQFLELQVGDYVFALGNITSYIKTGRLSFQIFYISAQKQGELIQDWTKLYQQLESEGLFALQKKLTFSPFFSRIAILTSLQGAALEDFLSLIHENLVNYTDILIIPCFMQGDKTESSIIQALAHVSLLKDPVELVLITRGGGASEDLYAFHSEALARYVAHFPLPVISAVGHEKDYTLLDYVSHTRYATPSAAAHGLFASKEKVLRILLNTKQALNYRMLLSIEHALSDLEKMRFQLIQGIQKQLEFKQMQLVLLHQKLRIYHPQNREKSGSIRIMTHNDRNFDPTQPIQLQDLLKIQTYQGEFLVQVIQKYDSIRR